MRPLKSRDSEEHLAMLSQSNGFFLTVFVNYGGKAADVFGCTYALAVVG